MSYRVLALSLALLAAAGTALAAVELILQDGRRVRGTDVRRDGGDYVVTLESGDTIALPTQLVESVRLTGEGKAVDDPPSPLVPGEPGFVAGQAPPAGPSGLRQAGPETLAGVPVRPPTPSEQLEVLGPPAPFQRDIIDNRWAPSTDWNMDPRSQNNFNPSTWAEGPIDPHWQPESAFDAGEDVLAPGRSKFQDNIIDPGWTPTDGFRKK